MWINLILLFICINFAIGMVTGVEGSPMYVVQQTGECSPFPIYGEDTDSNSPTFGQQIRLAPDVDPVVNRGQFANMTEAIQGELVMPTNSTNTDPTFGDGEPFNALLEPATRGWAAMQLMVHVVTGGYIADIIHHVTLSCQLDNRAFLTGSINSLGQVVDDMENGNGHNCSEQTTANGYQNNDHITVPCQNFTYGLWYDPTDGQNPMWDTFKYGINTIFLLLMGVTVFYWYSGRGHILSS